MRLASRRKPSLVPGTGPSLGPRITVAPVETLSPEEIALGRITITALLIIGLVTALAGLTAGLAPIPDAASLMAEGALLISVIPVVVTVLALWSRDPVGVLAARGLLVVTIIVGLVRPLIALALGALPRVIADLGAGTFPVTDFVAVGLDGLVLALVAGIALVAGREHMPAGRAPTLFERSTASMLVASHSVALVAGWLSFAAIRP